jgi:hypothetical protein
MKSQKSSESSRLLLPPMKQIISLVSERLTKSEIELLRLRKKHISDYAQKELTGRIKESLQFQAMNKK